MIHVSQIDRALAEGGDRCLGYPEKTLRTVVTDHHKRAVPSNGLPLNDFDQLVRAATTPP